MARIPTGSATASTAANAVCATLMGETQSTVDLPLKPGGFLRFALNAWVQWPNEYDKWFATTTEEDTRYVGEHVFGGYMLSFRNVGCGSTEAPPIMTIEAHIVVQTELSTSTNHYATNHGQVPASEALLALNQTSIGDAGRPKILGTGAGSLRGRRIVPDNIGSQIIPSWANKTDAERGPFAGITGSLDGSYR